MSHSPIQKIEAHVRDRVQSLLEDAGAGSADLAFHKPPSPELGDFAVPCFPLAKVLRKAPQKIAESLAEGLGPDEVIASVSADKGYLNIKLDSATVARATIGQALEQKQGFASGQAEKPLRYAVEYSSPNTNKPLHLGHLRNNAIGLSMCRILAHAGHDVVAVSLINDRGIHICKTMAAYENWGRGKDPAGQGIKGDHFVGDLYVAFSSRVDEEYTDWLETDDANARREAWKQGLKDKGGSQPDQAFKAAFEDEYFNTISPLGAQTRELLRKWEAGDEKVRELWARMNTWVYEGFEATYQRMGVRFDKVYFESDTYLLGRAVVDEGLKTGAFHRLDDGAVVCDYDKLGIKGGKNPNKVLLRGDGTTVYTTQDLGTALARRDELGFDRQVYVVGDEQKHHFKVLFALLGLVRPDLADACHHLAYGMVNLPQGKMKSREGRVVDADDLMDELAGLAAAELRSRSASGRAHAVDSEDHDEVTKRAEAIAQGALKFYLLSFAAGSTVKFDPAKSIDFLGKTGPYCLNAYARTQSVLTKAGAAPAEDLEVLSALETDREAAVVRALKAMPAEVQRAEQTYDPSKVADATFEVARAFNQLYTDKDGHPIVGCEDDRLRTARLLLITAVGRALEMGLGLLGIDVLEEM